MSKFRNSNATFGAIFKHSAYFEEWIEDAHLGVVGQKNFLSPNQICFSAPFLSSSRGWKSMHHTITTCYSIWLYRLLSTVGLLSLSFQDKRWLCTKMVSVTAHFCQFSPEAETNLEFYQQQQIAKRGIFSQCFCWSWLCILGSSSWLEDTALSTFDVWQIFRLVLPHPPDCNMSFVAHHNFTSPKVPLPERAS